MDTNEVLANFTGSPDDNAGACELAVRSGTYDAPVIDWGALGIQSANYRVTRTITDACGNTASDNQDFLFGISTQLDPITDINARLTATNITVTGCELITNVSWLIEDVNFDTTAFPITVGSFNGPPNNSAGTNAAVHSGTYDSPRIDWQALGVSGLHTVTRIITDSCGGQAVSTSEEFTV